MTVTTTITDLPDFFSMVDYGWHLDLVATPCRLMERQELGLLRVSDNTVVAFRYRDVKALSIAREAGNMPIEALAEQSGRREAGGRSQAGAARTDEQPAFFRMLADQAFTHNPPLHEFTRRMLARQFLLHNVHRFEPIATAAISSLLASLEGRTEIEFAAEVARRYVASFWGDILGMTAEEMAEVAELMRDMSRIFQLERLGDDSAAVNRATQRYVELVTRSVDRSLVDGGNRLIEEMASDLAAMEVEGKPTSLGSYVAANLFDGFHTAGVAVCNALFVLLATSRYEDLQRDPSLTSKASEEALRIAPPLLLTHRYTLSDIVHDGVLLPAGTAIAMLWGGANLDQDVFPDPWAFRLDRDQPLRFTFGGGPHLCPGRNAARMLVNHALNALVACRIELRLVAGHDYGWTPASAMRELVDFPIEARWPRP